MTGNDRVGLRASDVMAQTAATPMGEGRTAWHYFLGLLLTEKAPRVFEVRTEEPLTKAVQRMDWLVLRRCGPLDPKDTGETLVDLWPLLPAVSIVEFKSASRQYRPRDLHRLIGYGHQYFSERANEAPKQEDLGLVLMVGVDAPALHRDLAALGLRLAPLGAGYFAVAGLAFPAWVVDFSALVERLPDEFVALFSANPRPSDAVARWWYAHRGPTKDGAMDPQSLEDFDELAEKIAAALPPHVLLRALSSEQRLAGLAPEQRLAGLAPEQLLLALPDTALRGLSAEYVATLPAAVQDTLRKRLGG